MATSNAEHGGQSGKPFTLVQKFAYSDAGLKTIEGLSESPAVPAEQRRYLGRFPTVYVAHGSSGKERIVYVGETNSIFRRTRQHLIDDPVTMAKWEDLRNAKNSSIYVIGSSHFNKSLTLDIENRLINYMLAARTGRLLNSRRNEQGDYYTREHRDALFEEIWARLHSDDPVAFPSHEVIRDSAIFKASPFHELTKEQSEAKQQIIDATVASLRETSDGHLILVEGAAGTGKTVLLSSLFLSLFNLMGPDERPLDLKVLLSVNQDEHISVFQDIARRLGLQAFDAEERGLSGLKAVPVIKPTSLVNRYREGSDIDVILVDEAHLLLTQGKQSYTGENQLLDLLRRAKVVIAIYDPMQALTTQSYWEDQPIDLVEGKHTSTTIELKEQVRIRADQETRNWIRRFIDEGVVGPIRQDAEGYELRVFDSPLELHTAIKLKAACEDSSLSRIAATYDWPFNGRSKPGGGGDWLVEIGDSFAVPWNLQATECRKSALEQKLAWVENPASLYEVGSTYTVQGFDLHYAGIILGPSVTFREGRVRFDPSKSFNRKATNRRTLSDNQPADVSLELLRNELNVLLTRGVHGLYIYAVDDSLRAELNRVSSMR